MNTKVTQLKASTDAFLQITADWQHWSTSFPNSNMKLSWSVYTDRKVSQNLPAFKLSVQNIITSLPTGNMSRQNKAHCWNLSWNGISTWQDSVHLAVMIYTEDGPQPPCKSTLNLRNSSADYTDNSLLLFALSSTSECINVLNETAVSKPKVLFKAQNCNFFMNMVIFIHHSYVTNTPAFKRVIFPFALMKYETSETVFSGYLEGSLAGGCRKNLRSDIHNIR